MKCPKCDEELNKEDDFCGECGTKVEKEKKRKRFSKKNILIVVAGIVLIIGGFYLITSKYAINEKSVENIETNKIIIDGKEYTCDQDSFNQMMYDTEIKAYDGGVECAGYVATFPPDARMQARHSCPSIEPTYGFAGNDWLPEESFSPNALTFSTSKYIREKPHKNSCYAIKKTIKFECTKDIFEKLYKRVYRCIWNRGFDTIFLDDVWLNSNPGG